MRVPVSFSFLFCVAPSFSTRLLMANFTPSVSHVATELLQHADAFWRQDAFSNGVRFLVSVVGIPGSGKSTFSDLLVRELNQVTGREVCCLVPMDGFHLPKRALDGFADPVEAHKRRGAPFTFDPEGLLETVERCKAAVREDTEVTAPGWAHAVGDPLKDAVVVKPS